MLIGEAERKMGLRFNGQAGFAYVLYCFFVYYDPNYILYDVWCHHTLKERNHQLQQRTLRHELYEQPFVYI